MNEVIEAITQPLSKNHFQYTLTTTEKDIDGAGLVRVFGISVSGSECEAHIDDISSNGTAVITLLKLLEEHCCSPLHLYDVVEDFIA